MKSVLGIIRLTAFTSLIMAGQSATANDCPPPGARFERNNAGFIATLTSTGRADRGKRWCYYTIDGKSQPFSSQLKSEDRPLDPVPKQSNGQCPAGQTAQYKIVLTTYNNPILAGPDAAGRCQVRTEQGRLQWMHTDEFQLVSSASAEGKSLGVLPVGSVWRCTLPGIGMFSGANFGVVNGNTYRDVNGKQGSYQYDANTGVLRLTSGPGKGLAYKRQSESNFRVLDDAGKVTGGNCVWNRELSIQGRW
jgi:hypothetical protein